MSWPSWATLEAQIRARAPKFGVRADFAVAIANLESGHGRMFEGDGDHKGRHPSSFGPFQLHYGGVNSRFPHGGLGDVFTHVTKLNARNSSSWQAQVDFALEHFKRGDGHQWSTYGKAVAAAGGPFGRRR